jgi:hypothetical protein
MMGDHRRERSEREREQPGSDVHWKRRHARVERDAPDLVDNNRGRHAEEQADSDGDPDAGRSATGCLRSSDRHARSAADGDELQQVPKGDLASGGKLLRGLVRPGVWCADTLLRVRYA